MRLRRAFGSLVHESAFRSVAFLATDFFQPESAHAISIGADGAGSYASDVPALDAISRPDATTPVIFQTWKSRIAIPENFKHWRQSFVTHNPDWTTLLWDDDDNHAFIKDRFPWFLARYEAYPREIFRADIVRLFFLFEFGGFYADMDTQCLQPVAETATAGDVVLCRMGASKSFSHSLPNAIMASRPAQAFWLYAIGNAIQAIDDAGSPEAADMLGPEKMTGPELLKQSYDEFVRLQPSEVENAIASVAARLTSAQRGRIRYGNVRVLSPHQWYPLDWTNFWHKQICTRLRNRQHVLPDDTVNRLFPRSVTVTYWNHSW